MSFRRWALVLAAMWLMAAIACDARLTVAADETAPDESKSTSKIVPIYKTDAQWKKLLTPKQFEVTRRKGTEPAHSGKYWHNKRAGTYRCVCCDLDLFSSETKFDSQTGWPSFWTPIDEEHVKLAPDTSELPVRTEVLCARCAAHLGHVFADGPQPIGLRFCINSAALNFQESKEKTAGRPQPSSGRSSSRQTGR
ncbi:MAG TPA: peptide-methionine (R)-S-oxide reductase MsrB [Pirellulales bacterium]|jgi:peptide-methionine (R)-S-oxide reductase|nr:peptide-methionine (R)-S-oxide reductase MsrB [Pirellulales bacterium]